MVQSSIFQQKSLLRAKVKNNVIHPKINTQYSTMQLYRFEHFTLLTLKSYSNEILNSKNQSTFLRYSSF